MRPLGVSLQDLTCFPWLMDVMRRHLIVADVVETKCVQRLANTVVPRWELTGPGIAHEFSEDMDPKMRQSPVIMACRRPDSGRGVLVRSTTLLVTPENVP